MRILPRRLLFLGGAAAVAAGGFAFMASNATPASSAGEGANAVSGYTVNHIQYSAEQGWDNPMPNYSVSTVKFILTSDQSTAPANAEPAQVEAALEITGGTWQNLSCTVASWQVGTSGDYAVSNGWATVGQGWGSLICNDASAPMVSTVIGLDVEANQ